ncbi:hypothetical protein MCSV2_20377 [Mucispirillum schaedleri ASF457]|nr:hypothetical protein [Mucispirillum schaedleri]SIW06429.1 hypothetical protein MCSV2_20377 [Mucispirillum schaedleri ASF457]
MNIVNINNCIEYKRNFLTYYIIFSKLRANTEVNSIAPKLF